MSGQQRSADLRINQSPSLPTPRVTDAQNVRVLEMGLKRSPHLPHGRVRLPASVWHILQMEWKLEPKFHGL